MNQYGIRRYQNTLVRTADRRVAVVYLYDAAITACRQAADAIEGERVSQKGRHMNQAMAALVELASALDFERGGAMAHRLSAIYSYLMRTLVQANARNDAHRIRGCLAVLRILREGWEQISYGNPASAHRESLPVAAGLSV